MINVAALQPEGRLLGPPSSRSASLYTSPLVAVFPVVEVMCITDSSTKEINGKRQKTVIEK